MLYSLTTTWITFGSSRLKHLLRSLSRTKRPFSPQKKHPALVMSNHLRLTKRLFSRKMEQGQTNSFWPKVRRASLLLLFRQEKILSLSNISLMSSKSTQSCPNQTSYTRTSHLNLNQAKISNNQLKRLGRASIPTPLPLSPCKTTWQVNKQINSKISKQLSLRLARSKTSSSHLARSKASLSHQRWARLTPSLWCPRTASKTSHLKSTQVSLRRNCKGLLKISAETRVSSSLQQMILLMKKQTRGKDNPMQEGLTTSGLTVKEWESWWQCLKQIKMEGAPGVKFCRKMSKLAACWKAWLSWLTTTSEPLVVSVHKKHASKLIHMWNRNHEINDIKSNGWDQKALIDIEIEP